MRKISAAMLCLAACVLLVGRAQATCSGAAVTNPLYSLNATTWAFETQDGYGDAAIGFFTLSVQPGNTFSTGALNGTETSVTHPYQVQVRTQLSGRYQVNSDCLGGTLFFTGTATNFIYAFVVVGNELFLVNASENMPNISAGEYAASHGTAVQLPGPPQCPPGVSPNSLFAGTWFFAAHDYAEAYIGSFTASAPPGVSQGVFSNYSYTGTSFGRVFTFGPQGGYSYQVYDDCSGGYSGGTEFVFVSPGKVFSLNDFSGVRIGYTGIAVRQ